MMFIEKGIQLRIFWIPLLPGICFDLLLLLGAFVGGGQAVPVLIQFEKSLSPQQLAERP